jgi:hypothetical protein
LWHASRRAQVENLRNLLRLATPSAEAPQPDLVDTILSGDRINWTPSDIKNWTPS